MSSQNSSLSLISADGGAMWERKVLCHYPSATRSSASVLFSRKSKDSFRECVLKATSHQNYAILSLLKIKSSNVLKLQFQHQITTVSEVQPIDEADGKFDITFQKLPEAIIRFSSLEVRRDFIQFLSSNLSLNATNSTSLRSNLIDVPTEQASAVDIEQPSLEHTPSLQSADKFLDLPEDIDEESDLRYSNDVSEKPQVSVLHIDSLDAEEEDEFDFEIGHPTRKSNDEHAELTLEATHNDVSEEFMQSTPDVSPPTNIAAAINEGESVDEFDLRVNSSTDNLENIHATISGQETTDRIEINNTSSEDVPQNEPLSQSGFHVLKAPESSLIGPLGGVDKPVRKSSQSAARDTNNDRSSSLGVNLPESSYDAFQVQASLRGGGLTTNDLRSTFQDLLPLHRGVSPGAKASPGTTSTTQHQQNKSLKLSDIATRDSPMTNQPRQTYLQPTSNAHTFSSFEASFGNNAHRQQQRMMQEHYQSHGSPDSMAAVHLQKEVDHLIILNDQLNAALERSEMMRREDAAEYESKIQQLQLSLDEATELINQFEQGTSSDVPHTVTLRYQQADPLEEMSRDDTEAIKKDDELEKNVSSGLGLDVLAILSAQIQQYKEHNAQLQEELEGSQAQFHQLVKSLKEVNEEKNELLALVSAHAVEKAAWQQEQQLSNSQRDKYSMIEKELMQSRTVLEVTRTGEESSKLTISRLERLVNEQQELIRELSQRITAADQTDTQYNNLNVQYLSSQEEIAKFRLERDAQDREIQRWKAALESLKADVASKARDSEDILKAKQNSISDLQSQVAHLITDGDKARTETAVMSRRIDLLKENEEKLTGEIEILTRRLQLEQQSTQSQIASFHQSLDASKLAYDELLRKHARVEEESRELLREKSTKLSELQESLSVQRNCNQDLMSRNTLLEEQNELLSSQLQAERASKKKYKEQLYHVEAQHAAEQKTTQNKLSELQSRIEQQSTWLAQSESQLKQSEDQRRQSQESLTLSLQSHVERSTSLQSINEQLKADLDSAHELRRKELSASEEMSRVLNRTIDSLKSSLQQAESKVAQLESDLFQQSIAYAAATNEFENKLKLSAERSTELHKERQDVELRFRQADTQLQTLQAACSAIHSQCKSFAQTRQLSLASYSDDFAGQVREIVLWCNQQIDELQHDLVNANQTAGDQSEGLRRRIASLEETVVQTAASWKETQTRLEQADRKYLDQSSQVQDLKLKLQKSEYAVQELAQQQEIARREHENLVHEHDALTRQNTECVDRIKSLEQSVQVAKEREVVCNEEILAQRNTLSLREAELVILRDQLEATKQAKETLILTLQEREETLLQTQRDWSQEKITNSDLVHQVEHAQRKLAALEKDKFSLKTFWEEKSKELNENYERDELMWRESQQRVGDELREVKDKLSLSEDRILKLNNELEKTKREAENFSNQLQELISTSEKREKDREEATLAQLASQNERVASFRSDLQIATEKNSALEKEVGRLSAIMQNIQELVLRWTPSTVQEHTLDSVVRIIVAEHELLLQYFHEASEQVTLTGLHTAVSSPADGEEAKTLTTDEFSYAAYYQLQSTLRNFPNLQRLVGSSSMPTSVTQYHQQLTSFLQAIFSEYTKTKEEYENTYYHYTVECSEKQTWQETATQLEEQVQKLREQRLQADESHRIELDRLKTALKESFADHDKAQQDHASYLELLGKTHDEKLKQVTQSLEVAKDQALMEQQLMHSAAIEDINQTHNVTVQGLKVDCASLQATINTYVEEQQRLQNLLHEATTQRDQVTIQLQSLQDRYTTLYDQYEQLQRDLHHAAHSLTQREEALRSQSLDIQRLDLEVQTQEEKLRSRNEQVRLFQEQIAALEVEVAQELLQKEKLERQVERFVLKLRPSTGMTGNTANTIVQSQDLPLPPSAATRGNSTIGGVSRASSAPRRSEDQPSRPPLESGNQHRQEVQKLLQRRKNAGSFNATRAPSSKSTAVSSSSSIPSASSQAVVDKHELVNSPNVKLARLRAKIASSNDPNNSSRISADRSSSLDNSRTQSSDPLRLQDLLH